MRRPLVVLAAIAVLLGGVTALGFASVLTPDLLLPAEDPGNSNPGHRFKYDSGRYQYNLKTPRTLAPGTYRFQCDFHVNMKGEFVVQG